MTDTLLQDIKTLIEAGGGCGPDLEREGDLEFMNALARADGMLPSQFFETEPGGERERPFDRASRKLDFASETAAARGLLARSRDLRLLSTLAKLAILDRNLPGFLDALEAIALLVENRWEDVNPAAEDGDLSLRIAALQALDDRAQVVLPLLFTPLIRHPQAGAIAFRAQQIAQGAEPRRGEETPDATTIDRAFMSIEPEALAQQHDRFKRLSSCIRTIGDVTRARAGEDMRVDLDLLSEAVRDILSFLDGFVRRRDPSAGADAVASDATPAEPVAQGGARPAFASAQEAGAALAGVAAFFETSEPSNPALLLLRQAQRLIGKSFLEIMQILLPEQVEAAAFAIGRTEFFDVPVQRLSDGAANVEESLNTSESDATPVHDRASALETLKRVEAFYMAQEPTSPIPFLCERARRLATRDFLGILKEILPESGLKTSEPRGE